MEPIYSAAIVLAFIAAGELVSDLVEGPRPQPAGRDAGHLHLRAAGAGAEDRRRRFDDAGDLHDPGGDDPLPHGLGFIPLPTLLKQWRSVIIAFSGMLVAVLLLAAVVAPLFGFQYFVAGAVRCPAASSPRALTTGGTHSCRGVIGDHRPSVVGPHDAVAAGDAHDELPAAPLRDQPARRRIGEVGDGGEVAAEQRREEPCGRREQRHGRRDEEEAEPAPVPRRQPPLQPLRCAAGRIGQRCWPSPPTSPRRSSHCSWASHRPRSASPRSGHWRSPTRSASRWPVSSRSSWHRW